MDFTRIEAIVLDVDGVLTDGRLVVDGRDLPSAEGPDSVKVFHVRDGHAIRQWIGGGGEVGIVSGRSGPAVRRRAAELGIEAVSAGATDKSTALREVLAALACRPEHAAYIGDDLPDVAAMNQCALAVAVADAAAPVKRAATFVTRRRGGEGAVAELIDWLMHKRARGGRRNAEFGIRNAESMGMRNG